jgi:hypothetical protein
MRNFDDVRGKAEETDSLRQSLVVREDDDLARLRGGMQCTREAVDARGVHRLHRVVDDHESERALGQRRPRHEEAERQRVQLALAHDAKRHSLDAVHGDDPARPKARGVAGQLDPARST